MPSTAADRAGRRPVARTTIDPAGHGLGGSSVADLGGGGPGARAAADPAGHGAGGSPAADPAGGWPRRGGNGAAGDGRDARPPMFVGEPGSLAADVILLTGQEGRHAAAVRRLAPGERVDVTDGAGLVAECLVTVARPAALELSVQARRFEPRPDPVVTVVQALPKGDRGTLAVDLMTEAGVDEIVPWAAQRCVTRWRGDRGDRALARWHATARESAKQARRAWLPAVAPLASTAELAQRVARAALAVLLDPSAPASLAAVPLPRSGEIMLIVGPEGGVGPGEAAALTGAGAITAHLGPTVLRTSSAGLAAASVVFGRCGRWS